MSITEPNCPLTKKTCTMLLKNSPERIDCSFMRISNDKTNGECILVSNFLTNLKIGDTLDKLYLSLNK